MQNNFLGYNVQSSSGNESNNKIFSGGATGAKSGFLRTKGKEIIVSIIIFLVLDVCFIYINRTNFVNMVEKIQKKTVNLNISSAIITYLFMYLGLYYFIINQKRTPVDAFILGIVIYGTFEFTNMAIFTDWTIYTALTDTLWGGVLFSSTTYLTKLVLYGTN